MELNSVLQTQKQGKMEKEKKEGERERANPNTACASAGMSVGAQEGSSAILSSPEALHSEATRAPSRSRICDIASSMTAQNPISSSDGSTQLHIPQRSYSTPHIDMPQRVPQKKAGSAVSSKALVPQKGLITQGGVAPKHQTTQPSRDLTSGNDPDGSPRSRVQLFSPKQGSPVRLALIPQMGLQVPMESLDREKHAAIPCVIESLRGSMGYTQLPWDSTGMPPTLTTSAVDWTPPGAPATVIISQLPSAAAQTAGPPGTASGWAPVSIKIDAEPRSKTSVDLEHGKESSGGKVRKRSIEGMSYREERGTTESMGGHTLAVVTTHTVSNSGGIPVNTETTDGGKDGMAHTSLTAETSKGTPAIMSTTVSLQTLKGNDQNPEVSEHKKGPSTKEKRVSGVSTEKNKDPSCESAPSKRNQVALDSSGVPISGQCQITGGNSAPTGGPVSSVTVFLGVPSASSQHNSTVAKAAGNTGVATISTETVTRGPFFPSGLPTLDSTEPSDTQGSFVINLAPIGGKSDSNLATLAASLSTKGTDSATVWVPAPVMTVTTSSDVPATSSHKGLRDYHQYPHISKTPDPSGTHKDRSESIVCRTTSKGTPLGIKRHIRAHIGNPTLDGAPNVGTTYNDTQSGGTTVNTVSSDNKAVMAHASSTAKTREGTATVSASTSLQPLRACHSDQKKSMTKLTGKHTFKAPGERKRTGPKCEGATIKKTKVSSDSTGGPTIIKFQVSVSRDTPTGIQGSSTTTPSRLPPTTSVTLATGILGIASGWGPASTKPVTSSSDATVIATAPLAQRSCQPDTKVSKKPGPSGKDKDTCGGTAGKKKRAPPSTGAHSGEKGGTRESSECPTLVNATHLMTTVPATRAGGTAVTTVSRGASNTGMTCTSATADKKGKVTVPASTSLQALSGSHSDQQMRVNKGTGKNPLGGPRERKRRGPKCEGAVIKKTKGSSEFTGDPISRQIGLPIGRHAAAGTSGSPSTVPKSIQATPTTVQAASTPGTANTSVVTAVTSHPSAGNREGCDMNTVITLQQSVSHLYSTTQGTVAQGHSHTSLCPSGDPGDRNPRVHISDHDLSRRGEMTRASYALRLFPNALGAGPSSHAFLSRRPAPYSLPCTQRRLSSEEESPFNRLWVVRHGYPINWTVMPAHLTTVQSTSGAFGKKVPTAHTSACKPSSRGKTTTGSGGNPPFHGPLRTDPFSSVTLSGRAASSSLTSAGTSVQSELASLTRSLQAQQHGHPTKETVMPCHSTTAQSSSGAICKKVPKAHTSASKPSSKGKTTVGSGGNPPYPNPLSTDPSSSDTLSGRTTPSSLASAGTSVQSQLVSLIRSLLAQWHAQPAKQETKAPTQSTTALSISGTTGGKSHSVTTSDGAALNTRQSTTVAAEAPIFPAASAGGLSSSANASTQTVITIHPYFRTTDESAMKTLITNLGQFLHLD